MTRWQRAVAVALIMALGFSPSAAAKPVFDCTNPEVRRAYPAQCPELGVPFLLGGGNPPGGGGGGQCGGICGILRGIPGLGGLF